ncbi:hypothetical protein [Pseudoponticoccus marisrubri]|uniref:Uncharacterized protein n=1 Tax=Pseudoponticoccus marisrubri TaxID=1685382 RepID=A0A0W7WN31_9RHOB|nr:hypothetical protein [Pseudoponticoccus marisrubri]KUF12000.1 hypothetical protein AVJ23_05345 [Pseudoponticoccus marisrubri]
MSTETDTHADESQPHFMETTPGILLGVLAFLAIVAVATLIWGLPGLAMVMLATVPVVFGVLMLITVGK